MPPLPPASGASAAARTASSGVTLADLILQALTRHDRTEAFVAGDRRLTYSHVRELVSRYVAALAVRGVELGSGVTMLSPNMPESWIVQAATYLLGGRFTGLQPLASIHDHIVVCQDSRASVLVVTASLEEHGRQVLDSVDGLDHLVVVPDGGGPPPAESGAVAPLTRGPATELDLAWLQYTGGTTGRPKGVLQPHRSMVQMVHTYLSDFELPRLPRYLASAPLTHPAGLGVVPTLLRGGTVVVERGFDPGRFLDVVEAERINCVTGLPTMIYALLDDERPESRDLSSLEVLWYATGPMSPARLSEARARIGPVFTQIYGQTESTGIGTVLSQAAHESADTGQLASCGRPVVGNRVRLVDEDDHDVPPGEVGEIVMRNRGVMLGYLGRPEETEAALRHGWLHTGDLARQDEDGLLHIVDRKKDMIVSGGFNVYAAEVETALAAHPAVGSAAVIGVPDERWGEVVTAFVVARPGSTPDAPALQSFVKRLKGSLYAPKKILIVDSLPRTPVGKVDKKALRAPFWAAADREVH
ncbi:AMP-binding protein [Amycolatopsis sp. PS_44_ISF1]|uniref:AMP-binding protein n=1 Tax=Amycolatopsis sp. PS_44_ISF1 TaxID=2974917 RepID=UPI0028E01DCE|nr:AMP-binding protein [Amycolatopsis sp. PS_44_ISF1]MDT8914989.1 AMP-binding protein [Amycolatopsis sp. PS_44_ISF1]